MSERTKGPRKAMLFASAEVTDIEAIANDTSLILEPKFDGTRAMCVATVHGTGIEDVEIEFLSRNGSPLKHTAALKHIAPIREALQVAVNRRVRSSLLFEGGMWAVSVGDEVVLDGEIMWDQENRSFNLFDMPFHPGSIGTGPDEPYLARRHALAQFFEGVEHPLVLGAMAEFSDEKRALYEHVMSVNGEGVMAKSRMGTFDEGKRVTHSRKLKFYQTADVVVMEWHRARDGKNAAGEPTGSETGWIKFGVHSDVGVLEQIGRCSIIGKPEVKNGDVIEVKFLYRGAGGALVQPTMLKVREDREPESCGYDQFKVYSKVLQ